MFGERVDRDSRCFRVGREEAVGDPAGDARVAVGRAEPERREDVLWVPLPVLQNLIQTENK